MAIERLVGVERAVRGAFVRAIAAAVRNPGPLQTPDWSACARRVLVLRPEGVGDLILTTGLLRAIRERHPSIALDVLTVPNNAPVLEGNPHVRRVHLADPAARLAHFRWLPALRAERYDAVVDAMVAHRVVKTRTVVQLAALGVQRRVGVGGRENDLLYTLPVAPPPSPDGREPHQVELIGSLGAAFGVAPDADLSPRLYLSGPERQAAARDWTAATAAGGARGPRVLINISISPARAPWRRWPFDRHAALAAHLRRRHPDIALVVLALPGDRAAAGLVAAQGGGVALDGVAAGDVRTRGGGGSRVHPRHRRRARRIRVRDAGRRRDAPGSPDVRALPHPRRDAGRARPGHRADRSRTGGGRDGRRAGQSCSDGRRTGIDAPPCSLPGGR